MKIHYRKNIVKLCGLLSLLTFGQVSTVYANNNLQCKVGVERLIGSYQKALNDGNTGKVLSLYTPRGIFMPSSKPTSIGMKQIKIAYEYVFKTLYFNVKFHIDEIECHGAIAFVRTSSDGKIKLLEKNITVNNNSRELFVLKRIANQWKIYRYMFNEVK